MTLTYRTNCDGCGHSVDEWPEGSAPFAGWAHVEFYNKDRLNSPQRHDYCPACWEIMFCSLIKPRLQHDDHCTITARDSNDERIEILPDGTVRSLEHEDHPPAA